MLFCEQERGFLPLSAAFLSCSVLRTETRHVVDLFMDIVSYIEAIILSLLFSRSGMMSEALFPWRSSPILLALVHLYAFYLSLSGLTFLLCDPEVSTTVIRALRGVDDWSSEESASLRYASILISRGFFCHPQEVGNIVETHLKAVSFIWLR